MSAVYATGHLVCSNGTLLLVAQAISKSLGVFTYDGMALVPIEDQAPACIGEMGWDGLKQTLKSGFACEGEFALSLDEDGKVSIRTGSWIFSRAYRDGVPSPALTQREQSVLGALQRVTARSAEAQIHWPVQISVSDATAEEVEVRDLRMLVEPAHDRLRIQVSDARYVDIGHEQGALVLHVGDAVPDMLEPLVINVPDNGPVIIDDTRYRLEREAQHMA